MNKFYVLNKLRLDTSNLDMCRSGADGFVSRADANAFAKAKAESFPEYIFYVVEAITEIFKANLTVNELK